ncbi:hypothetical protein JQ594_17615 [Bradyrhizobium manausense]|uniref:hypothetical protein n=1 Tax=Bradyrhizobium manausense TaxID=989370 RepID=UPI001BA50DDD|nr:hypothetical protein [Bradyrhizobium manausense]MBR0687753.1 hypothetical protein [Bradyrhizobium manausense]
MLTGLRGQPNALTALVKNDWKLLVVVIALIIASCALELNPMWISLRYLPATYASHIAVERSLLRRGRFLREDV